MKPNISLSVDKSVVTEGDVVELKWSCENAESVRFTLDNGYKANTIDVEQAGSKKFRLNRSKGRTHLVIAATAGGKTWCRSVRVRVKKMKPTKAEYVHDDMGHRSVWGNVIRNSWLNFKNKLKMLWSYLPESKRLAYVILSALCMLMILSAFWPGVFRWGMFLVIGYLFWVILRR